MAEHIGADEAQALLDAAQEAHSRGGASLLPVAELRLAAPRLAAEVVRLRRELDARTDEAEALADDALNAEADIEVAEEEAEMSLLALAAERDQLRRERDDYKEAFRRILDGDAYPVGVTMRRFELHRDEDVSGVSGTGVVAEGVAFSNDGPVALRWLSDWPTSVVFHDRGVESLEAVHGHNGRTRIFWLDPGALGGGE